MAKRSIPTTWKETITKMPRALTRLYAIFAAVTGSRYAILLLKKMANIIAVMIV